MTAVAKWQGATAAVAILLWWLFLQYSESRDETRKLAADLYQICQSAIASHPDVYRACEMSNEDALDGAARRVRRAEERARGKR